MKLHEVKFICSVPDIHFGFKALVALFAVSPITFVALGIVITAERVAPMVPVATVCGKREHYVRVFVIANPVTTAFGPC